LKGSKEMIEGIMESILYASKVLDNHGWIIDHGMIGSKIFYINQTLKQVNISGLQCRRDAMKYKASSLAFSLLIKTSVVVHDDFTCPSLNLQIMLPKCFGN
jgi:hypothetical protein